MAIKAGYGLLVFATLSCGSHRHCYSASRQGIASHKLLGDQRGFFAEKLLLGKARRKVVYLSPCWQWAWWLQRGRLDTQSEWTPAVNSGWTLSGSSSLELKPQE